MASTTTPITRKQGIEDLIKHFAAKYSGSRSLAGAFYIGDIAFHSDTSGVSVVATEDITKGTVLLRLPKAEHLSWKNDSTSAKLCTDIKRKYNRVAHLAVPGASSALQTSLPHGDICLAVALLHDLAQQKTFTLTWPSVEEFKEKAYPVWNPVSETEELLKGTFTLFRLRQYWDCLRYAFTEIVYPCLSKLGKKRDEFLPEAFRDDKESLEENFLNAFLYASSLVRSRGHESGEPEVPEIIPLVDLINGLPSYCNDGINVEVGFALAGNQVCTQIVSDRDIGKGEELILSYGDIHPSACMVRYAFCPDQIVNNVEASLDIVKVHVPTSLGPPDELRKTACQNMGYPVTPEAIEREFFFFLGPHDFHGFKSSMQESDDLKAVRQFLILSHLLDDDMVNLNIRTGRLRSFGLSPLGVGQLLVLLMDSQISSSTTLNTSTNSEDLNHAASHRGNWLESVYNTRVCQRDTMALWRHVFCSQHSIASEHSSPTMEYAGFLSAAEDQGGFAPNLPKPKAPMCLMDSKGCVICGRTIRLKGCAKCKAVKYCGRAHQLSDWRAGHKQKCSTTLTG